MTDYEEEALQRMDERGTGTAAVATAVDVEDPIRVLDLESVIAIKSGANLKDVINTLNDKHIGCVTVLNADDETIGIFTERDVLRKIVGNNLDLTKEIVDNYMTKGPDVLSENDPIAFALNKMSDGGYRHVPITRNGKVKFMLSIRDIVDLISTTFRKKVMNLPPDPKQQTTQYGG